MAKSAVGDRPLQAGAVGLAIMRIFLGAFFLYCGIDQLMHSAKFIRFFTTLETPHYVTAVPGVWAYFAGFLHGPASAHHAAIIGWSIIGLELLVGALLVVGFLTRLAAFIPIAANVFFVYTALPALRDEAVYHSLWINAGFLLMAFALLISAAGRTWGLDALLARKTKVKLLW